MPRVRNAFKLRAADAPIIETSQFLQLYCPVLLDELQHEDLFVPKLILVRGSPGSGKSSLLRLFETETLLNVHSKRNQPSDQDLVERLTELGVLSERGPRIVGVYIHCDSSLRDIANLAEAQGPLRLFNTLLDTRVIVSFLRGVRRLAAKGCVALDVESQLEPLPPGEAPPTVFAAPHTFQEMEDICTRIEREFGTLLNSFPGDPLPPSIQPHARVYSFAFLGLQVQRNPALADLIPVVMLDDVQELYPEQREHLKEEFIRRASIPRWLALRTHVLVLEELISLQGAQEGREYRQIKLDEIFQEHPGVFPKFATNVIQRRLHATESLQQVSVADFKELLRPHADRFPPEVVSKALTAMSKRVSELPGSRGFQDRLSRFTSEVGKTEMGFSSLLDLEKSLILLERQANKEQPDLFEGTEVPETADRKVEEAATLFLSRRLRCPYYFDFDTLTSVASANVEQLLSTTAAITDRMIYRAELGRDKDLSAKEQDDLLKKCGEEYHAALEEKHRRGAAIRQFVNNLGAFCAEVTYRANAPIAPGVNGFGLTRQQLLGIVSPENKGKDSQIFREVITNAVAGNVLMVRVTKQGQAGSEKIVFYLNRLLCVRFRLPLNYGGWQRIPMELLIRMMKEPVPQGEMTRKGGAAEDVLWPEKPI